MKRAESYVGQTSGRAPKRKPAPPTLAIPAPTHQPRYQPEESPVSAERSDGRQKKQTQAQRSARHQGWNTLKEQRLEHTADTNNKDGRQTGGHSYDLERQDETWPYFKPRSEKKRARDPEGRGCFFFLIFMAVVIIIATAVTIKLKLG